MNIRNMPKDELELLSYPKIAEMLLKEDKKKMTTVELFKEVCKLLDLSEHEFEEKIADFFQTLTTSKEFILLEDGHWDLKSNHKTKVLIDEIYEEDEDVEFEENEENEDETTEEEATDDFDAPLEDEDLAEDDLNELSIVSEDELEE